MNIQNQTNNIINKILKENSIDIDNCTLIDNKKVSRILADNYEKIKDDPNLLYVPFFDTHLYDIEDIINNQFFYKKGYQTKNKELIKKYNNNNLSQMEDAYCTLNINEKSLNSFYKNFDSIMDFNKDIYLLFYKQDDYYQDSSYLFISGIMVDDTFINLRELESELQKCKIIVKIPILNYSQIIYPTEEIYENESTGHYYKCKSIKEEDQQDVIYQQEKEIIYPNDLHISIEDTFNHNYKELAKNLETFIEFDRG